MKILAVADEESKYLWEYYEPSKLRDIDHVIDVVIIDRQREFCFAVGFGNVVCAEARRDSRIGQRLRIKAFRQRLDVLCHLCGLLLF